MFGHLLRRGQIFEDDIRLDLSDMNQPLVTSGKVQSPIFTPVAQFSKKVEWIAMYRQIQNSHEPSTNSFLWIIYP